MRGKEVGGNKKGNGEGLGSGGVHWHCNLIIYQIPEMPPVRLLGAQSENHGFNGSDRTYQVAITGTGMLLSSLVEPTDVV